MCYSNINRRKTLSLVEVPSLYELVLLRHIGAKWRRMASNVAQEEKVLETWDFD